MGRHEDFGDVYDSGSLGSDYDTQRAKRERRLAERALDGGKAEYDDAQRDLDVIRKEMDGLEEQLDRANARQASRLNDRLAKLSQREQALLAAQAEILGVPSAIGDDLNERVTRLGEGLTRLEEVEASLDEVRGNLNTLEERLNAEKAKDPQDKMAIFEIRKEMAQAHRERAALLRKKKFMVLQRRRNTRKEELQSLEERTRAKENEALQELHNELAYLGEDPSADTDTVEASVDTSEVVDEADDAVDAVIETTTDTPDDDTPVETLDGLPEGIDNRFSLIAVSMLDRLSVDATRYETKPPSNADYLNTGTFRAQLFVLRLIVGWTGEENDIAKSLDASQREVLAKHFGVRVEGSDPEYFVWPDKEWKPGHLEFTQAPEERRSVEQARHSVTAEDFARLEAVQSDMRPGMTVLEFQDLFGADTVPGSEAFINIIDKLQSPDGGGRDLPVSQVVNDLYLGSRSLDEADFYRMILQRTTTPFDFLRGDNSITDLNERFDAARRQRLSALETAASPDETTAQAVLDAQWEAILAPAAEGEVTQRFGVYRAEIYSEAILTTLHLHFEDKDQLNAFDALMELVAERELGEETYRDYQAEAEHPYPILVLLGAKSLGYGDKLLPSQAFDPAVFRAGLDTLKSESEDVDLVAQIEAIDLKRLEAVATHP